MDRLALLHAWERGHRPELRCFGWEPPRPGCAPGLACLSLRWPCRFELEGQRYHSAAQWLAASQARLAADEAALEQILSAGADPPCGLEIRGLQPAGWRRHRRQLALRGCLAKFGQDRVLSAILRSTGDAILVDASPHDTLWGIGLCASDPRARSPGTWRGYNLLGFALVEVRRALGLQHRAPTSRAPSARAIAAGAVG